MYFQKRILYSAFVQIYFSELPKKKTGDQDKLQCMF